MSYRESRKSFIHPRQSKITSQLTHPLTKRRKTPSLLIRTNSYLAWPADLVVLPAGLVIVALPTCSWHCRPARACHCRPVRRADLVVALSRARTKGFTMKTLHWKKRPKFYLKIVSIHQTIPTCFGAIRRILEKCSFSLIRFIT